MYVYRWESLEAEEESSIVDADLPDGWKRKKDNESNTYFFYNKKTGEKSWRHPMTNTEERGKAPEQQAAI